VNGPTLLIRPEASTSTRPSARSSVPPPASGEMTRARIVKGAFDGIPEVWLTARS
jgi:hypothetical protein